jgi:GrpB-like predicted nucleotidyltransferase (UPF0157 family)
MAESKYHQQALAEPVWLSEWQTDWPTQAAAEAALLRASWPQFFHGRIEHFGSTAIPGMPAKPIIDLLVEVESLALIRDQAAPLMATAGYQLFWRPKIKGEQEIDYLWFIKRHPDGQRSHHLHMLTPDSAHWQKLAFCHYLQQHPAAAAEYARIKRQAATQFAADRQAYNAAKEQFIRQVMANIKSLS